MVVGKGIIDTHVLEKPSDVLVEKALNFSIFEFGVNKESANIRLDDIRESLETVSATTRWLVISVSVPLELSLSKSNSLVLH